MGNVGVTHPKASNDCPLFSGDIFREKSRIGGYFNFVYNSAENLSHSFAHKLSVSSSIVHLTS